MRDFADLPAADGSADWGATRDRVERYFDRTATGTWARLTSDAPVSRIRATVRAGRDRMRAAMLARLPEDLRGARVLDAGCGTGAMATELARRGAEVLAVDISPALVRIAQERLPEEYAGRVHFHAGDMLSPMLGVVDYVVAMDSLIYYAADDIAAALDRLAPRTRGAIVFTVAPRTPALMAMWYAGKVFPSADRSPVMRPHTPRGIARALRRAGQTGALEEAARVASGFYISTALEFRP